MIESVLDTIWLRPTWAGMWLMPLWNAMTACVLTGVVMLLLRRFLPKIAAVSETTAYEGLQQPLFWTLVAFGIFIFLLLPFLPTNTFGEDIKMVKESGLQIVMVLAILLAILTAGAAVSEEIEGRTAITVLSKPISRRDFVIGKLLGVTLCSGLMFVILGVVFLYVLGFKVWMDAKEQGITNLTSVQQAAEVAQVLPGLVLTFFETLVLTSVSVAVSTRLTMLANLLICFSVYLVGHLLPTIVAAAADRGELLQFVSQLTAVLLPNLDHFNIQTSIATGRPVPLEYLALAGLYALLYTVEMTVLALLMFEDRDLA